MILKQAQVFYKDAFQTLDVQVQGDTIAAIAPQIDDHADTAVDCKGKLLIPGVVDVHSHGCIGFDFSTATEEEMEQMLGFYAAHGVTSVAGTTMTMALDPYRQAMRTICAVCGRETAGSRFVGINMEGPFLGKKKKGAHDEQYLIPLDRELFEELDGLSGGRIRIVDLDPDLEGAMEFIKAYSKDKTVSIAHTACNYETAMRAFDNGADHITHLFNAMNGLHHRDPGIIGALSDRDVQAEMICDGIHIHPAVIRLMFQLCPEKLIIISDSMCACGLPDGEYVLGGLSVHVENHKATLADGTIAGSTTTAYDGMVNAIRFGVKREDAIRSATLLAAKSVGEDSRIGSIEVGKKADLVLTDEAFAIERVYCGGKAVQNAQ